MGSFFDSFSEFFSGFLFEFFRAGFMGTLFGKTPGFFPFHSLSSFEGTKTDPASFGRAMRFNSFFLSCFFLHFRKKNPLGRKDREGFALTVISLF